ncbi:hypothetical protein GS501_01305 [Saccharibacter sp. 17.LH.SD]|uniref:aspartate/glutamate racemase family protein n=1 Tax=Saccharibacter sp. 17.LH.SD TaxID=2689393 RepID=UPI0013712BEA|nr:aspartate/glutamate racemase family protein [Saccharibacter sp. 17.LH.SD]MXV43700.1 hypothetical protein [Saccharibacter sp. 17.LH.SD]
MSNLVILNPNTNALLTERLVEKASMLWGQGRVRGVTATIGAPYIASRVSHVVAEYAVLKLFETLKWGPHDKILMACFGDPAVKALREMTTLPVMGMAYAALKGCQQKETAIGIVTGGLPWKAMIEEFLRAEQLADGVVGVEVTEESGGVALSSEKDKLIQPIIEAAQRLIIEKKATSILMAGTGLSELKDEIAACLCVPVYCSFVESVIYFNMI